MTSPSCPVCATVGFDVFLEIDSAPVHVGVVWPDAASALSCPRGAIRLAFCAECGFIFNLAFDDALVDYSLKYDNALGFSPIFQTYERDLSSRLISRYDLRNKQVIELGAGLGGFLGSLCELGPNTGLGFDPSHDQRTADPRLGTRARVVKDYYTDAHAGLEADLVCCRHMLEHLARPVELLQLLRRNLDTQPDTVLYFEVPNAHLALTERSIWDVIYEHTSYFTPSSLAAVFVATGFEVLDVHDCYFGQFVGIEARIDLGRQPSDGFVSSSGPDLVDLVSNYANEFAHMRSTWNARIGELQKRGERIVLWGGGAKAVSFVSLIDASAAIERVVDINPGKQGSFLAGGGQRIVSPMDLIDDPVDVIVVMNPIYADEVALMTATIGLHPRILNVAGGERAMLK